MKKVYHKRLKSIESTAKTNSIMHSVNHSMLDFSLAERVELFKPVGTLMTSREYHSRSSSRSGSRKISPHLLMTTECVLTKHQSRVIHEEDPLDMRSHKHTKLIH